MKLTSGFHLEIRLKEAVLRRFSIKEPENTLKIHQKSKITARVGINYGPW